MNSLTLRVSSVKTGENVKKNADLRAALVTLPKHYDLSEASYCVQLRSATTVPEQVAVVKNVFQNAGNDEDTLQFLADLIFYSMPKHPVRNQLLKLFITAARHTGDGEASSNESLIVGVLSKTLKRLVEETRQETESSRWNKTVSSLLGCFDNFACSVKALEQMLPTLLPFLCQSVQKYLTELGVLSSPSVRNEYYLHIHNSVRLILACVQEFPTHMRQQHTDQLKQMQTLCKQLILDDEIPMDPRTNAGILMAYIAKIFDTYEAFMCEVVTLQSPNELVLCVGVINTFDAVDFRLYSAQIRDVCNKIDELANAHATVPNMLLCATRSLYQISKMLLLFESALEAPPSLDDAKLILRKLLIFAFCYLEHHMDSVRHICRELLRNIVALAQKLHFEFLLQKIYDACNSERLSLSMKCVVLLQAAGVLGAQEVLAHSEHLFGQMFAQHLGRDFVVNNLYEGLMCASHSELSYPDWRSLWLDYLLNIAAHSDERLPDIEALTVKAIKYEPLLLHYIIADATQNIPISTKLSALWAVRKCGIKCENFSELMQRFSSQLQLAMLCNCDETRIMALRLLVETHKTTELLTQLECEHLLTYVEYNLNCQSPATRQKALGLLGKALMRCELNLLKTLKEGESSSSSSSVTATKKSKRPIAGATSSTASSSTNSSTTSSSNTASTGASSKAASSAASTSSTSVAAAARKASSPSSTSLHLRFLKDLLRLLVANLFNGANFTRRTLSLQLLEQSIRVAINCALPLSTLLPPNTSLVLLETLGDSYEANKGFACNILNLLASNNLTPPSDRISVNSIKSLLLSVRPLDSVTGAYQLDYYCHVSRGTVFGNYDLPSYQPTCFAALRWLLQLLQQGHALAQQSILIAAKKNPLYGALFAAKQLLKQLDFKLLSGIDAWRALIAELITLCRELSDVVAPIVNSDSPEGHLPNDFSALPAAFQTEEAVDEAAACNLLSRKCAKLDVSLLQTTPQLLLLCAWRTIKEMSLLLGELLLRAPIQLSNNGTSHYLVSREQLFGIGAHFKQLLSSIKHRGAFEQAYVGFAKLCARLWRSESPELNSLPLQWLRELLAIIAQEVPPNSTDKICSTRRSAGLPFMMQALITSELQLGTNKSLHFCMAQLFQMCSISSGNAIDNSESRTHSLNILRALFRCTDLNEAVGEHVCAGVMCAIRSYAADTWSERNSATLLFAALVTRIFGVQRTRDSDNLNIRNRMTGRIFFLRYPKLYDFFLEELRRASELIARRAQAHKLHPLLLLLSRLYPSALEGTESNLKLSEFLPYISNCSACPEMQTRYLAAKAFVALIAKDAVHTAILRKCADILQAANAPKHINLNLLHGQLLQILLLLKSHNALDGELIGDIACTLVTFHEQTLIKNAVILKVMLDIFIELLCSSKVSTLSQPLLQQLFYFTRQQQLFKPELSHYYPVFRKSFYLYNMHMLRLSLPHGAIVDYLLTPPLTQGSVYLEETETCLNVLLMILMRVRTPREELAEFELSPAELDFMRSLSDELLDELHAELRSSKTLHSTLKQLVLKPLFYPECTMKAYAVLSLLDTFDFTLSTLLKEAQRQPSDVKSPLTMCVERVIRQKGVDFKVSQLCLDYLTQIAQPWNPDCLRLKASKIMSHLAVHYRKALERKQLSFIKAFIALMLSLLMDDDYEIRDLAAKTVLSILPEDIGLNNAVSTMAQRLFLQHTADLLLAIKADDTFILDVFRLIADTQSLANAMDEGAGSVTTPTSTVALDLEIFDKNEANDFAEPLKAIADTIVIYKNTFSKRARIMAYINNFKLC